jgi:hypothetical protein
MITRRTFLRCPFPQERQVAGAGARPRSYDDPVHAETGLVQRARSKPTAFQAVSFQPVRSTGCLELTSTLD